MEISSTPVSASTDVIRGGGSWLNDAPCISSLTACFQDKIWWHWRNTHTCQNAWLSKFQRQMWCQYTITPLQSTKTHTLLMCVGAVYFQYVIKTTYNNNKLCMGYNVQAGHHGYHAIAWMCREWSYSQWEQGIRCAARQITVHYITVG